MKKRLITLITFLLVITVTLCACNNKVVAKASITELDAKFKEASVKEIQSTYSANFAYYTNLEGAFKKQNINQNIILNRKFANGIIYADGKIYSGEMSKETKDLVKFVVKNLGGNNTDYIEKYLFNGSFLSFQMGKKDGVINGKGDFTEKDGTPDYKFPEGENLIDIFYGVTESDILNFIKLMELPIDIKVDIDDLLSFNNPLSLDWSKLEDKASKKFNRKEKAYFHEYAMKGEDLKNYLVAQIDANLAEAIKNDESLAKFKEYYDKYKATVMNWINIEDVVLTAKSDASGNLTSKNISYKIHLDIVIDDLNLFIEDFPIIKTIKASLELAKFIYGLSGRDGSANKISISAELEYSDLYSYNSTIDTTLDIFSGTNVTIKERNFLTYKEFTNDKGEKYYEWVSEKK